METTEVKKTPLVKRSTSYKIIIPAEVERTIRFLCERVWDTEWSGVLFYTPSGNFEDGSLEIRCVDILPMDIGNATYTEFNMSPDVISYMAQKPELLDCKMGLIHSHNNMSTFFSSTDTATLQEEGNDRNHFVSLIVNNAGKYTAAITRKIKYHSIRDLSYEGFNGPVNLNDKEEFEGEEIEYFNLDIVFEEQPNDNFKEIADRLAEIKKNKAAAAPKGGTSYNPYSPYGQYSSNRPAVPTTSNVYKPSWQKEPTLFDDDDDIVWHNPANPYATSVKKETEAKPKATDKYLLSNADIEKALIQLVTGSVTITSLDKETRKKVIDSVNTRFENRFGKGEVGIKLFEYWAVDFIEFILWYSFGDKDYDEVEVAAELAERLAAALEKLPQNPFIEKYIDILVGYAGKL